MQFRYAILYVADVRATLAFYEAAFGLDTGFLHDSGDYGELATGATKLAFSSHSLMTSLGKDVATEPPARPAFEIALETADVAEAFARAIRAGAAPVDAPHGVPWGQTIAYVRAPEGTLIEICSPVG
ncbi:MAG: hypothetical protein RLZZ528_670 [Pseudomonadota bacterium]|jgi:catechol 2,3-dioxygenase-like lactoylglutathione lyase family enzyme